MKCVITRPSLTTTDSSATLSSRPTLTQTTLDTSGISGGNNNNNKPQTFTSPMTTSTSSAGKASVKLNKLLGEPLVNDEKEINADQVEKDQSQFMRNKILSIDINVSETNKIKKKRHKLKNFIINTFLKAT